MNFPAWAGWAPGGWARRWPAGQACIVASGPVEVFERARPYLDAMTKAGPGFPVAL
jgi:hypothetical protein